MSNANAAFPSIVIQCKDRPREFCLNYGAFRALEELLAKETGNKDFDVTRDFDWFSTRISNQVYVMWAGFVTDALNDKEPWTLKKAEEMLSIFSGREVEGIIRQAMDRIFTPEQLAESKKIAEKMSASLKKKKVKSQK
jgi:hypothetical protein